MVLGLLIVLGLLLIFDFTGYLVLNKKHSVMTLPFGAMIFFGGFQMFSLFFMVYHAKFTLYRLLLLILLAIIYLFLFYKHRDYFTSFKEKFKDKYFILVLVLSILFAILVALISLPLADSWLYGALTFSTIDNNVIYSHNGHVVNGKIMSFHFCDGIYLFYSVIISLLKIDNLVAYLTIGKIIEAFLIIFSLGSVCQAFFNIHKRLMLTVMTVLMFCGCFFFSQYPNYGEVLVHTLWSVPMGINFFNTMGIFMLFIFVIKEMDRINKVWLLPLLVNASFFMSSSSLFILTAFLTITLIYQVIYLKTSRHVTSILIGYGVIASYGIIFVLNTHLYLMLCLLALGWMIWLLIIKLISKLKYESIRKIVLWCSVIYLVTIVVFFLLLSNSLEIIVNILLLKHDKVFKHSSHYYYNVFANVPIVLFTVLGLIYLYKQQRNIFYFIIIAVIFFSNPIAYRILGSLIRYEVYHRVYVLFMPSIIVMAGLYAIICLIDKRLPIKTDVYIISVLTIVIICMPNFKNIFTGFSNFTVYKYQSQDLYELTHYDYPKTKNVNFGGVARPVIDLRLQADNIVRYRGDLSLTDCSSDEPFYIILRKEITLDLPIEYSTPNYNIYYTDGGICRLNEN